MALNSSRVLRSSISPERTTNSNRQAVSCSLPAVPQTNLRNGSHRISLRQQSCAYYWEAWLSPQSDSLWGLCSGATNSVLSRRSSVLCHFTESRQTKSVEDVRQADEFADITGDGDEKEEIQKSAQPHDFAPPARGLAAAYKYAYNDAKFVNERARNDMILLSRGILSLDARARKDMAFLGSEFLKLDARVREDTGKIDYNVKKKAERLHHIATILKDKAKSRLKTAADQHWSDGALEADLRWADMRAKKRAMEDTLMALEFVKNIHDMMVSKMYNFPQCKKSISRNITLQRNGKTLDYFPGEVSSDRITAIQEAYWRMASALSEADGIDYTDPEELELLITTLIDLDAMDGKSSVSLLAECSNSPDVNTRQALANALAAAPSMWTLGNAGMGALQRLAEDSNPAVAAAASRAIDELKQQWKIEEGDSWRFMLNQRITLEDDEEEEEGAS